VREPDLIYPVSAGRQLGDLVPVRPVLAGQRTLEAGNPMNNFFEVAILYAGVFLLGVSLPWFFRESLTRDMADPWRKNRREKRENKQQPNNKGKKS
jgi:hypothetical protein